MRAAFARFAPAPVDRPHARHLMKRDSRSTIPYWLLAGFLGGLVFGYGFFGAPKESHAPLPAPADVTPVGGLPLERLERAFFAQARSATWQDDITEFCYRDGVDAPVFFIAAFRLEGRYYFRRLEKLSRPLPRSGLPSTQPIIFTENDPARGNRGAATGTAGDDGARRDISEKTGTGSQAGTVVRKTKNPVEEGDAPSTDIIERVKKLLGPKDALTADQEEKLSLVILSNPRPPPPTDRSEASFARFVDLDKARSRRIVEASRDFLNKYQLPALVAALHFISQSIEEPYNPYRGGPINYIGNG